MIQESGQSPSSSVSGPSQIGFRFGVFELDLEAGELRKDGRLTRIRNQPLKVLAILLARPGAVVTRADLYKELWHPEEIVDFDQGLNHSIREIRAILADNADSPRFIQTLPRRGYRFLAEVRPLDSAPAPGAPRIKTLPTPEVTAGVAPNLQTARPPTNTPDGASDGIKSRWTLRGWGGVGVMTASVVGLSAWLLQPPLPPPSTSAVPRLLILPFVAASESTADELVADGLTDEVISRVGRARPGSLTVLGRTSSMEYKRRTTPLSELRKTVDVTYVLEGRVQRTPEGMRAIASLVQASDGTRLWTLDDKSHTDLWSFQESVSERVARGIDGAVELSRSTLRRSPKSVEANVKYLQGRARLGNRDRQSLEEALALFEECTRDEPAFAPAWASIAEVRIVLMDHGLIDPGPNWAMVRASADRSIALDANLAEGWNALAAYHSLASGSEEEARRAMERALTLNPNLVVAHHWNAVRLTALGRHKEAETSIRRAINLDPLAAVLHGNLGDILASQGRNAEALGEFDIVLDLRPDWPLAHVWKGRGLGREGRWVEAIAAFERGASGADGAAHAYLVVALVKSGRAERAREVSAQMKDPNGPYIAPYYRALASFALGDRDAAIADLRKTVGERSPLAMKIGYNEDWKGFETDPRFQRLVDLVRGSQGGDGKAQPARSPQARAQKAGPVFASPTRPRHATDAAGAARTKAGLS